MIIRVETERITPSVNYFSEYFCANVFIDDNWFKEVTSEESNKEKFEINVLQIILDDLKQDL